MIPSWVKQVLFKVRRWFWPKTIPPHGIKCPLCGKRTVQYKRNLNRGMVLALAAIRQMSEKANNGNPTSWVGIGKKHKTSARLLLWLHHREYSKLEWFRLLEQKPLQGGHSPNHDPDSGKWRLTQRGLDFLDGKAQARKFVRVVHNEPYRWSKKWIWVWDAYEEPFTYQGLVQATVDPWKWTLKPPKK